MSVVNEAMFDVRSIERSLAEGKITREQYDAWLAALPDDAAAADSSHVQMVAHMRSRRPGLADAGEDEEG